MQRNEAGISPPVLELACSMPPRSCSVLVVFQEVSPRTIADCSACAANIYNYAYLSRNRANIPKRAAIDAALLRLAPTIPPHERMVVVDHAVDSRGLSTASPETAVWLSLVAYVRHTFTDYDELLAEGYDPDSARHFVAAGMDKILQAWGVRRRLTPRD